MFFFWKFLLLNTFMYKAIYIYIYVIFKLLLCYSSYHVRIPLFFYFEYKKIIVFITYIILHQI